MNNLVLVLFLIGVQASPFATEYFCKDPDTGKYYLVNETWPSTSFCGNYTCRLRLKNSSDEIIKDINETNLSVEHIKGKSGPESRLKKAITVPSKKVINENDTSQSEEEILFNISQKTTTDVLPITHKTNSDLLIQPIPHVNNSKSFSSNNTKNPKSKTSSKKIGLFDIEHVGSNSEEINELSEFKPDSKNIQIQEVSDFKQVTKNTHKIQHELQVKENKTNTSIEHVLSQLHFNRTNNNSDGYLTEDEIKSITEVLHNVKKSDIDIVVQIYNLAQEIYKSIDKATDENILEDTLRELGEKAIASHANLDAAKAVSDTVFEGTFISPEYSTTPSHFNTKKQQDALENSFIGSGFHNPLVRIPHNYNYQNYWTYVPNALINHREINPYTATTVPMPLPGNYGSPVYATQTTQKSPEPTKAIPVSYSDYMYFDTATLKPVKNDVESKPMTAPAVPYNPGYYPYQYMQYNMSYPMAYPVSYFGYPGYVSSYMYSPVAKEETKENTKDCEKGEKCKKEKKDKKGKSVKKDKRKDIMPDWQTKPLSKNVLDEVKANILEKSTILPLALRKKVKLEKVGKVIKLDEWSREKREINNKNPSIKKLKRDLFGEKGEIIEQKMYNRKRLISKERIFESNKSFLIKDTENGRSKREIIEDLKKREIKRKSSKYLAKKNFESLDKMIDYDAEPDDTNQEYETYIEKTFCSSNKTTSTEADSAEYNSMDKNSEDELYNF